METVTLTMVWLRKYERETRRADRYAWWYDMPKHTGLRHPASH